MNKNGRGMNLVISLLLIVLLVFWFSGILRSMEDTCTCLLYTSDAADE